MIVHPHPKAKETEEPAAVRVNIPIRTAQGVFLAEFTETGLSGLRFPQTSALATDFAAKPSIAQRSWTKLTTAALNDILAGALPKNYPPLDLTGGTPFQQSVWRQLLKIRPGQTKSYGEIAKAIGKPAAVRAVGGACGANPIPVLVPCHRVLAANGKLGGFSGGLDWKRRLLAIEGHAEFEV